MGRKPLSSDEKLKRKKARATAYYEANKERILQRTRETYDPEKKREYYNTHKDELKEIQKRCNIRRTHIQNYTEIQNALQSIPDGLDFKQVIKHYMDCGVRLMKDDVLTLLRICEDISTRN